jgi:acyl-CoA thioesterase-1
MPRLVLMVCVLLAALRPAVGETLICLGDSLTAGYGVDVDEAWPALLQQGLDEKLPGRWKVINAGVSGDTTAGGLARVPWLLKAHPDVVLICLGGNDGLRGLDPAASEANLDAMITRFQAAHARVVLAGMQLPTNYGADYRARFAGIYPRVAERHHVALMPFLLVGVGGDARLNQADGIHPNPQGHRLVARAVQDFLAPLLASGATVPAPAGKP